MKTQVFRKFQPLEAEWTRSAVCHACRSAMTLPDNVESDVRFLRRWAAWKGVSMRDLAAETRMRRESYEWLLSRAKGDPIAVAGLNRARQRSERIATALRRVPSGR